MKNVLEGLLGLMKNSKSNSPPKEHEEDSKDFTQTEIAVRRLNLPAALDAGVKECLLSMIEYGKTKETELTKRTEILANRDVMLARLQNQRNVFEELIKHTYQERAIVLQAQLNTLDKALSNGNTEVIKIALDGMVNVIQTSPFKNVKEMQEALGSKDFVVRLE